MSSPDRRQKKTARQLWILLRVALRTGRLLETVRRSKQGIYQIELPKFSVGEVLPLPSYTMNYMIKKYFGVADPKFLAPVLRECFESKYSQGVLCAMFWYVLAAEFRSEAQPSYLEGLFINMSYHYGVIFVEKLRLLHPNTYLLYQLGMNEVLRHSLVECFPGSQEQLNDEFLERVKVNVSQWLIGVSSQSALSQVGAAHQAKGQSSPGKIRARQKEAPTSKEQREARWALFSRFSSTVATPLSTSEQDAAEKAAANTGAKQLQSRTQFFTGRGRLYGEEIPCKKYDEVKSEIYVRPIVSVKVKRSVASASAEHKVGKKEAQRRLEDQEEGKPDMTLPFLASELWEQRTSSIRTLSGNSMCPLLTVFLSLCSEGVAANDTTASDRSASTNTSTNLVEMSGVSASESSLLSHMRPSLTSLVTSEGSPAEQRKKLPHCRRFHELRLYSMKTKEEDMSSHCVVCSESALASKTSELFFYCVFCRDTYCRRCCIQHSDIPVHQLEKMSQNQISKVINAEKLFGVHVTEKVYVPRSVKKVFQKNVQVLRNKIKTAKMFSHLSNQPAPTEFEEELSMAKLAALSEAKEEDACKQKIYEKAGEHFGGYDYERNVSCHSTEGDADVEFGPEFQFKPTLNTKRPSSAFAKSKSLPQQQSSFSRPVSAQSSRLSNFSRPRSASLSRNQSVLGSYLVSSDCRGKEKTTKSVAYDARSPMPSFSRMYQKTPEVTCEVSGTETNFTAHSSAAMSGHRRPLVCKWTMATEKNSNELKRFIHLNRVQSRKVIQRVTDINSTAKQAAIERRTQMKAYSDESTRKGLGHMQLLKAELSEYKHQRKEKVQNAVEAVTLAAEACDVSHTLQMIQEIDLIKEALISLNKHWEDLPERFRDLMMQFTVKKKARLSYLITQYKMNNRETKHRWPLSLNDFYCTRAMEADKFGLDAVVARAQARKEVDEVVYTTGKAKCKSSTDQAGEVETGFSHRPMSAQQVKEFVDNNGVEVTPNNKPEGASTSSGSGGRKGESLFRWGVTSVKSSSNAVSALTPRLNSPTDNRGTKLAFVNEESIIGKKQTLEQSRRMQEILGLQSSDMGSKLTAVGGSIFWKRTGKPIGSAANEYLGKVIPSMQKRGILKE